MFLAFNNKPQQAFNFFNNSKKSWKIIVRILLITFYNHLILFQINLYCYCFIGDLPEGELTLEEVTLRNLKERYFQNKIYVSKKM